MEFEQGPRGVIDRDRVSARRSPKISVQQMRKFDFVGPLKMSCIYEAHLVYVPKLLFGGTIPFF
jgi:hypothetical protein